jgi:hypothetical protein
VLPFNTDNWLRTAREIIDLLEGYVTSFRNKGLPVEVYMNPTVEEMKKLGYDISFTAVADTKEIYCWSTHGEFHRPTKEILGLDCPGHETAGWCDNMLDGIAQKQGKRYVMTRSTCFDRLLVGFHQEGDEPNEEVEALKTILERDWRWVQKYIDVSSYLRKYRKQLGI